MRGLSVAIAVLAFAAGHGGWSAETVVPLPAPDREKAQLPKPDEEGWISLFNGKDFTGWYGDPKVWRIKDGYIEGMPEKEKQGYYTFLIYNHPFSDFVLEAKVILVDKKGNSGIQIRSVVMNQEKRYVGGYQADISPGYFGALYEEQGLRGVLQCSRKEVASTIKGDDWNTMVITANGWNIKIETNGILGVDYEEKGIDAKKLEYILKVIPKEDRLEAISRLAKRWQIKPDYPQFPGRKEGVIALQYSGLGGCEVRFRDIRIKLLQAAEKK